MSTKVPSFINPGKEFDGHIALGLVDASTWRTEVLTEALLMALGIDTQAVQAAAIEADNSGTDRTAAIRRALGLKGTNS